MDLNTSMDVSSLATPIGDCVCIKFGLIDNLILKSLIEQDYDQAPVFDDFGLPTGLVETCTLSAIFAHGAELEASDTHLNETRIPYVISLEQLLLVFSSKKSALMVTTLNDASAECIGLLTLADLNRVLFRSMLYPIIASFETRLARLIEQHFENGDDWLKLFEVERAEQISARWSSREESRPRSHSWRRLLRSLKCRKKNTCAISGVGVRVLR